MRFEGALVRFQDEELKDQDLFRRIEALAAVAMPNATRSASAEWLQAEAAFAVAFILAGRGSSLKDEDQKRIKGTFLSHFVAELVLAVVSTEASSARNCCAFSGSCRASYA